MAMTAPTRFSVAVLSWLLGACPACTRPDDRRDAPAPSPAQSASAASATSDSAAPGDSGSAPPARSDGAASASSAAPAGSDDVGDDAGRPLPPWLTARDAAAARALSAPPDDAASAPDGALVTTRGGPLNVLLIVVDSLRADVLTGDRREVAPWLTRFAARSVSYARGYSLASVTARSIGSLMASRYASELVRDGRFFTRWYPDNLLLGERLHQAGLRVLGAFAHAYFAPASGLDQGFDDWRLLPGTVYGDPKPTATSARLVDLAKKELLHSIAAEPDARFFQYVHFHDPHAPYLEHPGEPSLGSEPRDRYLAEVRHTDAHLGAYVDWVLAQPWGARTAVIVTADHGECFGEHGQLRHGYELWEALIHVPLLIWAPGVTAREVTTPRSHLDLAPTILELAGARPTTRFRGVSLVSELYGGPTPARPVIADLTRDDLQDRRRALIEGDYKIIGKGDDERFQLFDLAHDPTEKHSVRTSQATEFRRMKRRYDELSLEIPLLEVRGPKPRLAHAPPGRRW